jgi:ABC-type glycerol-3-phosphate transport system permease component
MVEPNVNTISAKPKTNARKIKTESPFLSKFLIYTILIIGAVIAITPFFWMISNSLMTFGETIINKMLPARPNWKNYSDVIEQIKLGKLFLNSVLLALGTIAGLLFTSILAGYAFASINFKGKDAIFAAFLATMMIPESVTLLPNYLMVQNRILPMPGGSWMNTYWALTVPFMANAFSIFLLRQFFAQVPKELWDAARMDGADHLRYLIQIVLPISKAPILTVVLFAFTASWNSLQWPLLVTTKEVWRPMVLGLYSYIIGEGGPQTNLSMAAAVLTIIPILVFYFLVQKQFTQGIATTGLKG